MGNILPKRASQPGETFVGGGLFGVVSRHASSPNIVIKRQKYPTTLPVEGDELYQELRAFDWIDTLDAHPMQRFFARRRSHRFVLDRKFAYTPDKLLEKEKSADEEDRRWARERLEDVRLRNLYPYVCEIHMEDKGRALDVSLGRGADSARRVRRLFAQMLHAILFLQSAGVVAADIHSGNVLIQAGTDDIAVIDYGHFYFQGQKQFEYHKREHTMLIHFFDAMSDIDNNFEIEKTYAISGLPMEQRIAACMANSELARRVSDAAVLVGYVEETARAESPFMQSLFLDGAKFLDRDFFCRMMSYPVDAKVHTFFPEEDAWLFLQHLNRPEKFLEYLEGESK